MPGCCAFGCTNRHDKGFKMYRFPSDPNRRKIWENKVSRVGWKPASSSKLCEAHFDPHQFECGRADQKMKLKNSAVPTIFCHRRTTKSRKSPKKRDQPTKEMCPPKQHETSLLVDHSCAADPRLQRLSSSCILFYNFV
uniref:THAP domain-containing protein 1-like n=1 Tax=Myxine glutinosa TaxID=7769 RepID=UPI00358EC00C